MKKTIRLLTGMIILYGFCFLYSDEQNIKEFSGVIDIGEGRKIYLECQGSGLPTVVFVSGRTDRADIWKSSNDPAEREQNVFSEVAHFTRACAYDRPGTVTITKQKKIEPSRSFSVAQPTTPKQGVEDLHALLKAAKIPSPYVLVGHSYGGLVVRLYASTYPNEVVGLVLIDTLTEMMYDNLTPVQQKAWIHLNSNYSSILDQYTIQEKTDFLPSFEQLRTAPAVRSIPTIVLTSDQPYDFQAMISEGILPSDTPLELGSIIFKAHLRGQKRLAEILKAKHITHTQAGHYIQLEQPQLIVNTIRDIVDKIRNSSQ